MSFFKKSKLLKAMIFTGASVLSVAGVSVSVGTSESIISRVSSSTQATTADGADKTTATTGMSSSDSSNDFVANPNTTIDNTKMQVYPFDMTLSGTTPITNVYSTPSIIQNTAYDDNSNSGYSSFVKYNNVDAVAKFLSIPEGTSVAGSTQWVVTKDDLIKLATKQVTGTEATNTTSYTLTFKAMLFSAGGNAAAPSLFVLASIQNSSTTTINGSYLFQINWGTTTNSSVTGDKNAGSYRLAAVLSKDSSSFIDYNFLVMDGVSTNTLEVLQLGDLKYTTVNPDYSGYYVSVSNSIFNKNDTTATAHTLKFSGAAYADKIADANIIYKPVYVSNINSRFFMVFKEDSNVIGDTDEKSVLLVRTDLLTNSLGTDITISDPNNFTNLNFSGLGLNGTNNKFNLLFYYNSSNTNSATAAINMVVNFPGDSKYAYASFDAISFSTITQPVAYNYENFSTAGFISQIIPYYGTDSAVDGYYGLTSTNQVFKMDADFKFLNEIYNFSSSIYNVGLVYKIYTFPSTLSITDSVNTWYAQMTSGQFVKMDGSNFVGQWDSLSTLDSYEKAGDFVVKSQDEVDPSVFFQKVVNDNADDFAPTFLAYISGTSIWSQFLTTISTDSQIAALGLTPDISVSIYNYDSNNKTYYFGTSATNKLTADGNNSITLVFTQNLRKIGKGGTVDSTTTTPVIIGSYTYTFYYGAAKINSNNTGSYSYADYSDYVNQTQLSIPQYVLDMYPSKIATLINEASTNTDNSNFISSFLKMENIVSPNITASGNDTTGVLTINVSVPYIWESDTSISATANGIWTFTFGSSASPFFNYNPFGFTDATNTVSNASVTPIDNTFASDTENAQKLEALKEKYSTSLPSQLSKEDYYNNFLSLGSAFSNSSYISSGLIQLPTDDVDTNITVIPNDAEGNAFVSVTFPKIGPETDYTVSFTTPSIFMTDSSASQSVYFGWKSAAQVATIAGSNISDLLPSNIASTFNATSTSTSVINDKLSMLENFAVLSDYYANLISQNKLAVSASYDDSVGFLTITLTPQAGVSIPGLSSDNNLSMTYTGFKTDTTTSGSSNIDTTNQTSSFTWGTYSADANVSPSSVTVSSLLASDLLKGNASLATWVSNGLATVTLNPSNATGILDVTVTLKNYVDNGTISPTKTFSKVIGGFASTSQNTNMIVWKTNTNTSFLTNGVAKLPSAIVTSATSGDYADGATNYLYNRLTYFANLSSDLNSLLQSNPDQIKAITLQPNDSDGSLVVTAVIQQNGQSVVYSTTITGLGTSSLLQPTITFNVDDTATNNAALNKLREMTPSTISTNNSDLLSLFTIANTSGNYVTSIDLSYDDFGGSLTVKVTVTDPSTNTELATSTKSYTGFVKSVDTSAGTNWGIVVASIIVPLVVLIIPVFLYGYIQQRKDMKIIAKKLSNRLQEEEERERRLKRRQEMLGKLK